MEFQDNKEIEVFAQPMVEIKASKCSTSGKVKRKVKSKPPGKEFIL